MSIRIQVISDQVRNLKGVGRTSLKPYDLNVQTAWAYTFDRDGAQSPFPEKIEFMLDRGQAPYPVGDYTVSPSAFYVQDGRLQLSVSRLTPVQMRKAA